MTLRNTQPTIINNETAGRQDTRSIVTLSDGGWVVVFTDTDQTGVGNDIRHQVFNSDGSSRGAETVVNAPGLATRNRVDVSPLSDGGFVVAWQDFEITDPDAPFESVAPRRIFTQAFDASGGKTGAQIEVQSPTGNPAVLIDVAGLADGGWVTLYNSQDDSSGFDSFGLPSSTAFSQRYDENGSLDGDAVRFAETPAPGEFGNGAELLALADGGFVVFTTGFFDGLNGIFQQAFDANGRTVGERTRVSGEPSELYTLTTARLADGGWAVNWTFSSGGGGRNFVRSFNSDGSEKTGPIAVSNSGAQQFFNEAIAPLADGGFVVAWIATFGGPTGSIRQRVFNADGSPRGDRSFVHSPEDGRDVGDLDLIALSDGGWVIAWQDQIVTGDPDDPLFSPDNGLLQIFDASGSTVGEKTSFSSEEFAETGAPFLTPLDDGGFVVSWNGSIGGAESPEVIQTIFLDAAAFVKVGTAGSDIVDGNALDERFTLGAGDDVATGRGGADTLSGGRGLDDLRGGQGDDVIRGGGGSDTLRGGGGADTLSGGGRNDLLFGGGRGDQLSGGGGRDDLSGGGGRDDLSGGGGADTLEGGRGADVLAGGLGRDVFEFRAGDGRDRITDFRQGQDKILINQGAQNFDDITITQRGDAAQISFASVRVVLEDQAADDFTAQDFLFS